MASSQWHLLEPHGDGSITAGAQIGAAAITKSAALDAASGVRWLGGLSRKMQAWHWHDDKSVSELWHLCDDGEI